LARILVGPRVDLEAIEIIRTSNCRESNPGHVATSTLTRVSSPCSGNGYITTQTLREILAALDDKLGPDDLDGIIAEIDTDGSGTVDFDGE
jgi:hypothetical protein